MATLLLIIIYISFIGLGLPDAILGSSWASISTDFGVYVDRLGIVTMTITGGTIISSFLSGYLIKIFKTGLLTMVSTLATAVAILGMAFTNSFLWFWFLSIPLGLGAGAIDVALNNYVALHYESRHMNWLHSFWGLGALTGPMIMSYYLNRQGWRNGYFLIALCQLLLTAILFFSLPIWRNGKNGEKQNASEKLVVETPEKLTFYQPKVLLALIAFMMYSATEMAMNAWGSTYAIKTHDFSDARASVAAGIFFIGITAGRFLVGFISAKFGNRWMIRLGQIVSLLGTVLLIVASTELLVLISFVMIGLGCAPIYPAMLHETPNRFGEGASERLMGFQMGFSYIGGMTLPPLLGVIARHTSFQWIPYFLLVFIGIMWICSELLNMTYSVKPSKRK